MASTSNSSPIPTHGVNGIPENSTFDLSRGLAEIGSQRDDPYIFKHLDDPEWRNGPSFSASQVFSNSFNDGREPYWTPKYEGWVPGGSPDTASVPMQLLNLEKKERAALSVIYPKAKVEGNCITTTHYVVVVKLFLRDLLLSENGMEGVPNAKAYACLLSRLSRELGSCSFDDDSMLDPADIAGCLSEVLNDMEETWKRLEGDGEVLKGFGDTWGPDVCVYVRRATDKYAECLLAAADELNNV
ncbi:hypothetical protein M758_4G101400 [Ceratodon purpureus]|nr:hypothetical protein M758_4G101400 [Ceratodon purpureus]